MGLQYDKQPASYVFKTQTLNWTGSGVQVSTNFTSQTYQVRIISQVAGYVSIGQSDSTSISSSSRGVGGFDVPATTAGGEYFIVRPGQVLGFSSTSTSSGSVNIAEMA